MTNEEKPSYVEINNKLQEVIKKIPLIYRLRTDEEQAILLKTYSSDKGIENYKKDAYLKLTTEINTLIEIIPNCKFD
jgi:hypothetical protein